MKSLLTALKEALDNDRNNLRKKTFQTYESKYRIFKDWMLEKGYGKMYPTQFGYTEA
ncbi:MAG: hypothetical protein OHK0053_14520 [Microscillaceae bacterium]